MADYSRINMWLAEAHLVVGREDEASDAAVNSHHCAVDFLSHVTSYDVVLLHTDQSNKTFTEPQIRMTCRDPVTFNLSDVRYPEDRFVQLTFCSTLM